MYRNRFKEYLMDLIFIAIVAAALYGAYYSLFKSDGTVINNEKINIEKVEQPEQEITKIEPIVEAKTKKEEKKVIIVKQIVKAKEVKKITKVVKVQKIAQTNKNQLQLWQFYKNLKLQMQSAILANNPTAIPRQSCVNRITILKNGTYEQNTILSGINSEYCQLVNKIMQDQFPVKMYKHLAPKFPRYFKFKTQ
jgi:hypothetical protein